MVVENLSDHMIIMFSWRVEQKVRRVPFKFNRIWLEDPEYNQLVAQAWKSQVGSEGGVGRSNFSSKLRKLKFHMKLWETRKNFQKRKELDGNCGLFLMK